MGQAGWRTWDALQIADAPAVRHALQILTLLARQSTPTPAATVARDLGLPRSTVYRVLGVLEELDFVTHLAEEHRWGLGVAAFELGFAYSRQGPVQWVARNALTRLVDETGYSGHLAVLHGSDVLYLAEERPPGGPSLVTDVGIRLPAYLTASGLAMLALLERAQLSALFPARSRFIQRHGQGPRSVSALRTLLSETRQRGWAVEDGTVTPGYASVACAVRDHAGRPAAALTLTFSAHQLDGPARSELAGQVGAAAAQVSRAAGYRRGS